MRIQIGNRLINFDFVTQVHFDNEYFVIFLNDSHSVWVASETCVSSDLEGRLYYKLAINKYWNLKYTLIQWTTQTYEVLD